MSRHRLTVLSLATALLTLAFAQDNQCFYAANQRAGSIIVPCSSTGTFASCCQLGDLCLSDSACWNPTHNVTYLYGCTDSSYQDFTCPYKCGPTFSQSASTCPADSDTNLPLQPMRHTLASTIVPIPPTSNGPAPTHPTATRPFKPSTTLRHALTIR